MPDTVLPQQIDLPIIDSPQAWYGPEQQTASDWQYTLTAPEIAEIEGALTQVGAVDILDIDAAAFPLPNLTPRLGKIRQQVLRPHDRTPDRRRSKDQIPQARARRPVPSKRKRRSKKANRSNPAE